MKIKLFTIPNMLTLSNLLCGSVALIEIFVYENFVSAFILIIAAAAFDFLDGMMARLLGQYSEIGRELDSLSDMISFGAVPAMAMFALFNESEKWICDPLWVKWGAVIPLFIACASALRLARFNVDSEQQHLFIGLPTPANSLFCMSICMLSALGKITLSAEVVALTSIVMSVLLIAPIRLFALKFSSFGWQGNQVRYIFLLLALFSLIIFREFALPIIIALYVVIALIENLAKSLGADKLIR